MKAKQRSKTAEGSAACRAWHLLYGNPRVFEDPFAIQLTSFGWRTIINSRILTWLIVEKLLRPIRPIFGEILGRARYTEDLLDKAIKNGIDQYIILSAGLDSFALRRKDLTSTLRIYELDHPTSQESKKKRFRKLSLALPNNLELISIDFEKENLAGGLKKSLYSNERRAFFSWLGTTPYLTRDVVFHTLRSVALIASPGSEIVFDYMIPKKFVGADDLPSVEALDRFVKRRGEPFKSTFDPHTFPQDICNLGFEIVEHLSPEQLLERYFADRNDNLRQIPTARLVHFRLNG